MIAEGLVLAVLGGPPCETWSAARNNRIDYGSSGPRPLRAPGSLWGLMALKPRERRQLALSNALLHAT
eukprot:8887803-Karenia_brevis.AAC.1